MHAIRHVIWDFNGTLLDDVRCCVDALGVLLRERSLAPISHDRYRREFGFPVQAFYEGLGFDFSREDFDSVSRAFITRYLERLEHARVCDGAREALGALRARKLGQSVLSAMEQSMLCDLLDRYELRSPMTHVRGLADLRASSKLELGRMLAKDLREPPSGLLVVGDTLHDAETAKALGCACVLVAHGHQERERLEQHARAQANVTVVDSLVEVVEFVERRVA